MPPEPDSTAAAAPVATAPDVAAATAAASASSTHVSTDTPFRSRVGLPPGPVFAALGLLSALYFAITGTVWAVTGEFTRLGGHVVELFDPTVPQWAYFADVVHLEGDPLSRTDGWIVVAMLGGSLVAALAAGDFRLRVPELRRRLVQAFVGGIVAGFGARMAFGCNLAAMFTGIPQFSLHAWVFTAMTALGTWLGVRLIRLRWWQGPTIPRPAVARAAMTPEAKARRLRRHRATAAIIGLGLLAATVGYALTGRPMLAVAVVFGTAFGALIQRGQICFTAAFRDLWVTGKTKLADALVLGLVVATVATFIVLQVTGTAPLTKPVGWHTVIGGVLFGLGIVMAGACETGMMYRATEGQTSAWLAFIGNIVGATVLAYGWDHWGIQRTLVAGAPKIDLLTTFGPWPALALSLAALGAWSLAMRGIRTRRRARLISIEGAR